MITLSIDVTLLDKTKFKNVTRKNGNKAVFCELILLESDNSTYGDYMVKQSITKEDRQAGVKMPIIGNGKIFGERPSSKLEAPAETTPEEDSSVPF